MQHIRDDVYRLSSGREFRGYGGVFGLGYGCGSDGLFAGYDDYLRIVFDAGEDEQSWSPAERAELADEMIRRWTVFREGG